MTVAIAVLDFVKVRRGNETFWVIVKKLGDAMEGIVNNDLVLTHQHGFKDEDPIEFSRAEVLDHIAS